MTHTCPVVGCQVQVPKSMLMCAPHWRMVPFAIQGAVYREFRKAPQSRDHLAACSAATTAVNNQLTGGK